MELFLPDKVEYVLSTLNNAGFEAYIVGGCVRDILLGKTPQDFDITTSARPEDVQSIFDKTVPTGIQHGTVTVIIDKTPFEVTTFRTEGDYTDHRRPDKVDFVRDVKADLSRRDFTVNALAYNSRTGIVDAFDGRSDLEKGILRAVGEPQKRFEEDALRILRLFRFACTLGFVIEENTLSAAKKTAHLVEKVSRERIFSELIKTICGTNTQIINTLLQTDALSFLSFSPQNDLSILKELPNKAELRLFTFLKLCECDIFNTLNELKASNLQKEYCLKLNNLLGFSIPKSKTEIKKMLAIGTEEIFCDYLEFVSITENIDISPIKKMFNEIIKNNEPYRPSQLDINGSDLSSIGLSGKEIGNTLSKLLEIVIADPEKNKKSILMEYLK